MPAMTEPLTSHSSGTSLGNINSAYVEDEIDVTDDASKGTTSTAGKAGSGWLGSDDDSVHYGDDDDDSVKSVRDEGDLDDGSFSKDSRMDDFEGELEDDDDPPWDVFEETAWENLAHADREFWASVNRASRVVLCVLLFLLLLSASSATTFSFLIIAYNMGAAADSFDLSSSQVLQEAGSVVRVRWVWAAIIVTTAPYFFTLCSSVVKLCVKRTRRVTLKPLLTGLCVETCHSVGLGAFVLVVAPSYDPLMVVILSQAVTLIPALLRFQRVHRHQRLVEEMRYSWLNLAILLVTALFLGLMVYRLHQNNLALTVVTPISLLLLSVEWWENFVPVKEAWKRSRVKQRKRQRRPMRAGHREKEEVRHGSTLFRAKYDVRDCRTRLDAICSVWKIFLNLVMPLVVFASRGGRDCASALYYLTDSAHGCSLWKLDLRSSGAGWCETYLPFVVAAVAVACSGTAFKAAKVACKIHAQKVCFALPLALSAPVTLAVAVLTYRHPLRLVTCSTLTWPLLHDTNVFGLLKDYSLEYWLPLFLLGWLAFCFTAGHVWRPAAERVASTDKLFVRPLYCGVMLTQSLMLNRAVDDSDTPGHQATSAGKSESEDWTNRFEMNTATSVDRVEEEMKHSSFPMIYACATMWHETETEMTQLLKSLFRMDQDQFTRSEMWKKFNVVDKDFYRFEAHIFFDDAFEKKQKGRMEEHFVVNKYVALLLECVDDAARAIYPHGVCVPPPTKMDTPYGGRLTYTLPGKNPLVVHLKNKFLIRNKKRWSQVMYMYYLLSYKLLLRTDVRNKRQLADNTFLLVLDGDVDFYPDSVQLLVDRMRRSSHVGAACGRIHPIGSGLMVWYQKFEYAVSHWLQKATEHVFGCVLCSPGCFSLFRGSALMEDNVLRRYTTVAATGRQAVQYDMGEDRWLCTLMLQQGKRVEYAAAADALTFCPDDFGEFYKQRRRWTPSTMANILDLLLDWRHVTKRNGSISLLFIAYQAFLFVSSVLTPGTIFLLILGAISTAYPSLPMWGAMVINLLPILIFIVLCFYASQDAQISYATVLSTVYSLVMMVVMVGLLRQATESGMCSVTSILFVAMAGIFVLAAILHPQEATNLLFGLLYFLAIPSMSMVLVSYAVANLNVVSWGTRDTSQAASGEKKQQQQQQQQQLKQKQQEQQQQQQQKKKAVGKMIAIGDSKEKEEDLQSDYTFSFGNLFRCLCCPTPKVQDAVKERFEGVKDALVDLRRTVRERQRKEGDEEEGGQGWEAEEQDRPDGRGGVAFEVGERAVDNPLFSVEYGDPDEEKDDVDPFDFTMWIEDPRLDSGSREFLSHGEELFWKQLIDKYLSPINPNDPEQRHHQERITEDLTSLRNKMAMLFFLGNGLFVTVIFILESVSAYTSSLTIDLPCSEHHIGQKIEPISVTFTLVFGILLVLQLVGMILHRFSTFVHIVAATSLRSKHSGRPNIGAQYTRSEFNNEFYDLIQDLLKWQDRGRLDREASSSGYSSSQDLDAISRDTLGSWDRGRRKDITSRLIARQKTFRSTTAKPQNLSDVMDEGLRPTMAMIDKVNPLPELREPADGDVEEGVVAAPAADQDDVVIPRGLRWMRGRSQKAVASLAQDPARRQLVRARTDVQEKWKDTARKLSRGARPPTMSNIVLQAMEKKRSAAGGRVTLGAADPDGVDDQLGEKARRKTSTVNFRDETPAGGAGAHGGAVPRITTPPAGALKPGASSKWSKVKAAGAGGLSMRPVSAAPEVAKAAGTAAGETESDVTGPETATAARAPRPVTYPSSSSVRLGPDIEDVTEF